MMTDPLFLSFALNAAGLALCGQLAVAECDGDALEAAWRSPGSGHISWLCPDPVRKECDMIFQRFECKEVGRFVLYDGRPGSYVLCAEPQPVS